jgi:hypothetical protein
MPLIALSVQLTWKEFLLEGYGFIANSLAEVNVQ